MGPKVRMHWLAHMEVLSPTGTLARTKVSVPIAICSELYYLVISKLNGHLTSCTSIKTEHQTNVNVVASGAADTNVKMWDLRMKQCINTYKGHGQHITCLDISPDSKIIVSGSKDGTIKFWDTQAQRLLKSIKVSGSGYPVCMSFNPCDLCIAVGTSNKYVKYWELQDFTLVSSSNIENYVPRALCFNASGESCFVAYDDCTKVYLLDDEVKPKVLDVIQKPFR